jgi:hypothetical protein
VRQGLRFLGLAAEITALARQDAVGWSFSLWVEMSFQRSRFLGLREPLVEDEVASDGECSSNSR